MAIDAANSPSITSHKMGFLHHKTPTKSRVQGAVQHSEYLKARYGQTYTKADIFRSLGVSSTRGWAIIRDYERTFHNNPFTDETRGRKKKLSDEDIDTLERFLWQNGVEGRTLPYQALLMEAGIEAEVSDITIRRALGTRDWGKCIACQRGFVSHKLAERRVEEARKSLELRPHKRDWRDVRSSDEFHVSSGASGRVQILRKPGERYCPDCIVERPEKEEDKQRAHFWAAIGYEFKSDLIEYKVSTNKNGKISQRVYHDTILEGVVKGWLDTGERFILEEDGDSGHGPRGQNIVKAWKTKYGLKHYFNCPRSPDWVPIENA